MCFLLLRRRWLSAYAATAEAHQQPSDRRHPDHHHQKLHRYLFVHVCRYLTRDTPYGNGLKFSRKKLEHGFPPLMVFCRSYQFSRTSVFSITPPVSETPAQKETGACFQNPRLRISYGMEILGGRKTLLARFNFCQLTFQVAQLN